MFDLGWMELLIIGVVALIVVGPKDLPKVLRSITSFVRKIKSMATQFHSGIDDLANEAEIANLRKEVTEIEDRSIMNSEINDLKDFKKDLNMESLKNDVNEIKNIEKKNINKKSKLKTKKL
mgnify:CR=1 FL=1